MERPYQIWPLSHQPDRLIGMFEKLRLPGGPFLGGIDETAIEPDGQVKSLRELPELLLSF